MNKYKIGKVPKCDAMDSKFFSNPNGFEKDVNKGDVYVDEAFDIIEDLLSIYSTEYVEQGLGVKENFEKDIIIKMMLKRM